MVEARNEDVQSMIFSLYLIQDRHNCVVGPEFAAASVGWLASEK